MNKNFKFVGCIIILTIILIFFIVKIVKEENERSSLIPMSFSEISQIEKDNKTNMNEYPLTEYYAKLNDACMNIFEAYNLSKEIDIDKSLAHEFENITEIEFKVYHYNLTILVTNILDLIDKKVYIKCKSLFDLYNNSLNINKNLNNAWTDNHHDVTHIETRTSTYTDSDGNTQIETYYEEVYDYTIHTYTFFNNYAIQAQNILNQINNNFYYPEELKIASHTHADGEYAVTSSWKNFNKDVNSTNLADIINSWNLRTTYMINKTEILNKYNYILQNKENYINSISASHSIEYKTYSHSDSGPTEFQINENMKNKTYTLCIYISEILNAINFTKNNLLKVYKDIKEYEEIVLDSKKGNKNKLQNDILVLSKEIYIKNFKVNYIQGYFNYTKILGLVLLGLMIYGGIIYFLYKKFNIDYFN
jgi:hypothetical protein